MKNLIFVGVILLLIASCSTTHKTIAVADGKKSVNDTVRIANDSLEYEVIIIDPGFSSWLASRAQPRNFYGLPYLENKNIQYVSAYNSRVLQPRYQSLYEMRIDYSPLIHYGYEVNYLLYNYFVYFQNTYNQNLGGYVPSR